MGMENVKELLVILIGSSLVSNVVLSQFLGLCPFLGVSRKTNTAAGMGAALLPGVPPSLGWWGVTAMSFAIMVLSTLLVVVLSAAVQGQTPPELLGKVMAFIMAVSNCAAPLGQAVYGALFEVCPAWAVLLGAAGAAALAAAWSRGVFRDLDGA